MSKPTDHIHELKEKVDLVKLHQINKGTRFREDYGDIPDLCADIANNGIIQSLAVEETDEKGKYLLLAGGRRFTALTSMDWKDNIPVRIYPALNDLQRRTIELAENLARKNLTWQEQVSLERRIHQLQVEMYGEKTTTKKGKVEDVGWSKHDSAELTGQNYSSFIQDLKLAEVIEVMPEIAEADSKHQAKKLMNKAMEQIVLAELAKRMEAETEGVPIEKYHKELSDAYILKDFFEGIKTVPDACVDIVEIDPPYGINLKKIKKSDTDGLASSDYNEIDARGYEKWLDNVLKECTRVMNTNAWLIPWFAPEPWFETIYQLLEKHGLKGHRMAGIWTKPSGQSQHPDVNLGNAYEMFFYARKGRPTISQARTNVFNFKPIAGQSKHHPTERPIELIEEILHTFGDEGSRILVPFLGSGNTLLAASNLKMKGFGYELTETYRDSYILRVRSGLPGRYKSYRSKATDGD